jgi:hypothetical protein
VGGGGDVVCVCVRVRERRASRCPPIALSRPLARNTSARFLKTVTNNVFGEVCLAAAHPLVIRARGVWTLARSTKYDGGAKRAAEDSKKKKKHSTRTVH